VRAQRQLQPYRYWGVLLLLLYLLTGADSSYAQDSSKVPRHIKDTVLPKVDSLQPVTVLPTVLPPRMRGDTLEYNTSNIKLRPYAAVEELLAKLPGLRIQPDGTILYNGEKINQLLVDGEDIFGSNPTLITRNLDGSRIARVQLLDRKSEKSQFTGVDDGSRTKTINLVLKESSKNGYFGKAEAGGNTNGPYNANAFVSSFHSREQITGLGMASNTGVLGFSDATGGAYGNILLQTNSNDALGASAGTGIPRSLASALHYANTWDGSNQHLIGNYQYNTIFTQPVTTSHTVQSLPDTVYTQDQQSRSTNRQNRHWTYGAYDLAIDSLSAFKFSGFASDTREENQLNATGSSLFNGDTVNSSQRSIRSNVDRQNMQGTLSFRRRSVRQPEKIFSVSATIGQTNNTTNGYLYSMNHYYPSNGTPETMDTTDQRKVITSHLASWGTNISYTQPLWKRTVLALEYGLSVSNSRAQQATYDRGNGKYLDYIDSLSSDNRDNTVNQRLTLNLQGGTRKLYYAVGGNLLFYTHRQSDQLTDSVVSQRYLNFAPRIMITTINNPKNQFSFIYTGSTQQPSITQLQPVKNNNDPLHIFIGNPDLKPGYNNNFALNYHHLGGWVTHLSLKFGLTGNTISTRTTTDSLGRQISRPVNVNGGRNLGLNFSINRKVLGMDLGFNSAGSYGRNVNYVGSDLSHNDNYSGSGGMTLAKYVQDLFSIRLDTKFTYQDNRSSVNTNAPVRYWTQNHNASLSIFALKGYELGTQATYTWQEKTSVFDKNTSVLLWNAAISRNFLDSRLAMRLQAINLLDRNSGISRSNSGNTNTEASTNILGRYWMLSLTYHFNHQRRNN
jgi:hypothetical protein